MNAEISMAHLRRAKALAAGVTKVELEVPSLTRMARTDFSAFCEVLGKPNARHHLQWVEQFVTNVDSSQLLRCAGPNTAVLAPRGSAKSTLLGMFCAWLIGLHSQAGKMLQMLYLGYSLDIARSRSHTIKAIINGRNYQEVFPMVRLSKTRQSDELWSIDYDFAGVEIAAADPFSVCAQGLGGSITSRRSQLIVLDDVVKSSESISNPQIRTKLIQNWQEVVQPTLLEGGRTIALGTRFSTVDIFGTTFTEKNGWKVVTQRAIEVDESGLEKSYWPSFYTLEHLQKLRSEDPISFAFQFQNSPVSRSEIDFPADWLKTGDLSNEYDALCVGIDLSSGLKERNDFTVFCLAGIIGDKL
jgi:hypothetical protein